MTLSQIVAMVKPTVLHSMDELEIMSTLFKLPEVTSDLLCIFLAFCLSHLFFPRLVLSSLLFHPVIISQKGQLN